MSSKIRSFYEFGSFRFDAEKRVLWRGGEIVALAPKASEVLLLLVQNHGNLLERKEIIESVWKETFVEEGNLNHAVSALRRALGDGGERAEMIQTVPRRGYRFAAPVREVFEAGTDDLIVEKHTISQTLIEESEEIEDAAEKRVSVSERPALPGDKRNNPARKIIYASVFVGLCIILAGAAFRLFQADRTPAGFVATKDAPKTLAIIPLQSLSDEAEVHILGAGIAENLAARLGQLEQLIVRPNQSVKTLAEAEADPIEIGRKLKADFVMTGSFQRLGGRIRVTVRLLSAADGAQIWAGSFDETETDIFKLQDLLSAQVSRSLVEKLTPHDEQRLASRSTDNVEAYKLYLKGRYHWNERSIESYFKAIELFDQAIALDPNFAPAYSGLADCYSLLEQRGGLPPEEAFPKAEEAARKALELDETLAEAHVSMALVKNLYRWDWAETEKHLRRALELDPDYAVIYGLYGMSLLNLKRFDEAEAHLRKAESLDPTSRSLGIYLAWKFYFNREFDEAVGQSRRVLELDPNVTTPYMVLRAAYEQKGMFDEAVEAELKRIQGDSAAAHALAAAYRESGIKGFWEKQVELFQNKKQKSEVADYHVATRYALLNRKDEAFREIEKGFVGRGSMWHQIGVDPAFDGLRGDPRFADLLRKLNLPR